MTVRLLCRCCPGFFDSLSGIFNPFPDRSRGSFCAFLDRFAGLVGGLFNGFFGLLDWALILRPNDAEREHCKDDKHEFSHKEFLVRIKRSISAERLDAVYFPLLAICHTSNLLGRGSGRAE
jgi:hypothetical protein